MEITYSCMGLFDMEDKHWEGRIRFISLVQPYEFEVSARGSSFRILLGRHAYGRYICIPDWDIGTGISTLADSFWNLEKLSNTFHKLSLVDAISIVDALAALDDYISL